MHVLTLATSGPEKPGRIKHITASVLILLSLNNNSIAFNRHIFDRFVAKLYRCNARSLLHNKTVKIDTGYHFIPVGGNERRGAELIGTNCKPIPAAMNNGFKNSFALFPITPGTIIFIFMMWVNNKNFPVLQAWLQQHTVQQAKSGTACSGNNKIEVPGVHKLVFYRKRAKLQKNA